MMPEEKALYHQIHPAKLATDISAEFVSSYFFWKRRLLAGLLVLFVPPLVASTLVMRLADLEQYKQFSLWEIYLFLIKVVYFADS